MTKTMDPRDDPAEWIAADPLLTQAEAEWYARHWREVNTRGETRDRDDHGTVVTRIAPSRN